MSTHPSISLHLILRVESLELDVNPFIFPALKIKESSYASNTDYGDEGIKDHES